MQVRFKKLDPRAVIPSYAHTTDAGIDLTAISVSEDKDGNFVYGTGLAVEIPQGYVGLIFPRSSIAKHALSLSNAVGVIDSAYRGEIITKFKPAFFYHKKIQMLTHEQSKIYKVGERIAQMIILPYPTIEPIESAELTDTDRDSGGFGSTGN